MNNFDFFDLKKVFLFLTFYFIFIPFIFDFSFGALYAVVLAFLGVLSFYVGFSSKVKSVSFCFFDSASISSLREKIVFFTVILFISYDSFLGLMNLFTLKTKGDYTESFEVLNDSSLYLQLLYITISTVKYFLFSLLMSKGRNYFYLIFISQIFLFLPSSTRLMALYPFIVFIVYGYYMGYVKITFLRIFLFFFISPFLFVILLLMRGSVDNKNYFQVFEGVFNKLSLDQFLDILKVALESFQSFYYFVKIVNDDFVHLESGLVRIFFLPISRAIWADKPEAISRIISKEYNYIQYENHGGSVATIFGDAFVNGHIVGVIVVLFILGFMSKFISFNMKCSLKLDNYNRSIFVLFYSMFLFQFLYYFRGFFSESIWKFFLIFLVYFFCYRVFFRLRLKF